MKFCPICRLQSALNATECVECGHKFRTKFPDPAAAQVAPAAPAHTVGSQVARGTNTAWGWLVFLTIGLVGIFWFANASPFAKRNSEAGATAQIGNRALKFAMSKSQGLVVYESKSFWVPLPEKTDYMTFVAQGDSYGKLIIMDISTVRFDGNLDSPSFRVISNKSEDYYWWERNFDRAVHAAESRTPIKPE